MAANQEVMGTTDTNSLQEQHNLSIMDEVLKALGGTSEKFVPQPTQSEVLSDAIRGLRRFKDAVRWKEFFRLQKQEERKKLYQKMGMPPPPLPTASEDEDDDDEDEDNRSTTTDSSELPNPPEDGLETGLRPIKVNLSAPKGTDRLEAFLKRVEEEVLNQAFNYNPTATTTNKIDHQVREIQQQIKAMKDTVIIPTDKTNTFRPINLENYTDQVLNHLRKSARLIPRARVVEIWEKAITFYEDKKYLMASKEQQYIEQSLKSKAIPSPKLLIKDHKPKKNGEYPTRLIIPATNFASALPKMGYLGIKAILDRHKVEYMKTTIIQASDLKQKLETYNLQRENCTIISLDAVDFYPSIRYKLVVKAVHHYSKGLPESDKDTIKECLHMIQFGMAHNIISFRGSYYECDGDKPAPERGLTIGGYESAWLADLVGSYILEMSPDLFNEAIYYGLYRDDGLVVLRDKWKPQKISGWREAFQRRVDSLAEGDYLQFTCSIWDPKASTSEGPQAITVHNKPTFPYLDMELFWKENNSLAFKVHLKPNQQLKYLNKGSTHTSACLRAIPRGVFNRLAKLTTMDETNRDTRLSLLYPHHLQILHDAGLLNNKYIPTLQEQIKYDQKWEPPAKRHKERNARRTIYFCVGYSRAWVEPIHKIINRLRKEFGLTWLRTSMSYHRYPNLRELFQGDLTTKLNEGIDSEDFKTLPCNCRDRRDNGCNYGNVCRQSIVVYKVECKMTGKIYIGNTQQKLKTRMQQHFTEVKQLHTKGRKSDSFASHFATQLQNFEEITPRLLRGTSNFSVIWKGNPLAATKTFGTPHCALCSRERLEILRAARSNPDKLINSCNEIYGACRHKPRFHRYCKQTTSTDEAGTAERIIISV